MHTDGFDYGHDAPDAMFLLCDIDSAVGGESVLIDDLRRADALPPNPRAPTAAASPTSSPARCSTSPPTAWSALAAGQWSPTRPPGRRLFWLGALSDCVRPMADDPDPAATVALFDDVAALFELLRQRAARFRVAPGEAICVDNHRFSHSRDAYTDTDRLFWRVWAWTDLAIGVPEGKLASDTRYAQA